MHAQVRVKFEEVVKRLGEEGERVAKEVVSTEKGMEELEEEVRRLEEEVDQKLMQGECWLFVIQLVMTRGPAVRGYQRLYLGAPRDLDSNNSHF